MVHATQCSNYTRPAPRACIIVWRLMTASRDNVGGAAV